MARAHAPLRRMLAPYGLIAPTLLVLAALALFPILNAAWTSLYHDFGLGARTFVGFGNFVELWHDAEARTALWFTLLFVACSVPAELVIGLAIALVIHRTFRGRGWVRASVLVPWAIPTVVTSWMWLYIFDGDRGLLNFLLFGRETDAYVTFLRYTDWARAAVIVADVWKTAPFAALLILAGLQAIPDELDEAARIDGAGPWRRFFTVTLPLLRPALLIVLLFRTIDAFRVFDLVYVMTRARAGTDVLQYLGYQRLIVESNFGVGCAVAVVTFVLIAAVSIVYVRAVSARLFEAER
jgi:trehalose/maltose transport system permease protein